MKIAKVIESIIKDRKGTDIAKKIGVRPHQINRLKTGERDIKNISIELAQKILDAFPEESSES